MEIMTPMRPQQELVEYLRPILASSVCLKAISRTLELSLQSSFQLSLTVLVRYRTRGSI
jgi:hypothetical protein